MATANYGYDVGFANFQFGFPQYFAESVED
jgi:hypothetical protein